MSATDIAPLPWASCELLVAFKFAEQGYAISVPLVPQSYDLVVDAREDPPRLVRVQVKKAKWKPQRSRPRGLGDRAGWRVILTRWAKGRTEKHRLHTREFDYLVAVCDPTRIYVIPVDALKRPDDSGELLMHVEFKPPLDGGRKDSVEAGARWTAYLNQFQLR